MRSSASSLLPLLRSQVQGDLLAVLYLHPDQEYSLTEAAKLIGASVKTVHTRRHALLLPDSQPTGVAETSACCVP